MSEVPLEGLGLGADPRGRNSSHARLMSLALGSGLGARYNYRGTSLRRNSPLVGPCSRTMFRALRRS